MSCHLTERPEGGESHFTSELPEQCLEPRCLQNPWSNHKQTFGLFVLGFTSWIFKIQFSVSPFQLSHQHRHIKGVFFFSLSIRIIGEKDHSEIYSAKAKQPNNKWLHTPLLKMWPLGVGEIVTQALPIPLCDSHNAGRAWQPPGGQRKETPKCLQSHFFLLGPLTGRSWEDIMVSIFFQSGTFSSLQVVTE